MRRIGLDDLRALVAVARAGSFTKAAGKLGVSQSALSQTVKQIEDRLGVRLLARTTRSVSLTEAGERLVRVAEPRFEEIEATLDAIEGLRERPAGTVRINAGDHAIRTVLWPKLKSFLPLWPDIDIEIVRDNGLTDIVAERFDAGVRWGEQVGRDMIAVRIGPDLRFAAVAAPSCFVDRNLPLEPQDLVHHACINMRLPTRGGLYAWEFEKDGREVKVRVEGRLVFNDVFQILDAALEGFGIAYIPEDLILSHVAEGRLVRVLDDWCPPWSGYHLYYPHRSEASPAFAKVVEALRHGATETTRS